MKIKGYRVLTYLTPNGTVGQAITAVTGQTLPTFHMPDGTKTTNRPKDGQVWTKWDANQNPIETWQWDDFLCQWFNISSGKPTQHNTKTFAINCPMDLDNLELDDDWRKDKATITKISTFKCNCGSEAVGSPRHSHWCDKYEPAQ